MINKISKTCEKHISSFKVGNIVKTVDIEICELCQRHLNMKTKCKIINKLRNYEKQFWNHKIFFNFKLLYYYNASVS